MHPQLLLQSINSISQKYALLNQKTGNEFNIFKITNISKKEVPVCRVLYELLSPSGSHFQKERYLALFVETVLGIKMSADELATARVYREYMIDENRRIDLVIETNRKFIPIEVKIFATDQPEQCFDYYQEAKQHMAEPVLFYLTRFGTAPDEISAKGLTSNKEIVNISFAEDILRWLDLCVKDSETLKISPIREIILQFMSVIRQFTDQMETEMEKEIENLLLSSSENMRSAVMIQNSLQNAKEAFMKKLFLAIESKVGIQKLDNEYDYSFENDKMISEFYGHSHKAYSIYPGISYLYKSNINKNVDIWVRLAIEKGEMYVGYCCPVNQRKTDEQILSENEIKTILDVEPVLDGWWAYYEYCQRDDQSDYPDFININDEYLKLFDEEYFNRFVDTCAKRILSLLRELDL